MDGETERERWINNFSFCYILILIDTDLKEQKKKRNRFCKIFGPIWEIFLFFYDQPNTRQWRKCIGTTRLFMNLIIYL